METSSHLMKFRKWYIHIKRVATPIGSLLEADWKQTPTGSNTDFNLDNHRGLVKEYRGLVKEYRGQKAEPVGRPRRKAATEKREKREKREKCSSEESRKIPVGRRRRKVAGRRGRRSGGAVGMVVGAERRMRRSGGRRRGGRIGGEVVGVVVAKQRGFPRKMATLFNCWAGKKLGQDPKPGRNGKNPDEMGKTRMEKSEPGWNEKNPDGIV
ncbi:hypothetical protein LXL04_032362 [Taraxacum kok-saghyz]